MDFVHSSLAMLERTPKTLHALLDGLPDEWLLQAEGPGTWSAFDVVGHLIFCEKTNFYNRIQIIRAQKEKQSLPAFDMSNQFEASKGKNIHSLLTEFANLREQNIYSLRDEPITAVDLAKTAIHPKMGTVTLGNILATWTAHDLSHTAQIARVLSGKYRTDVGPFIEFLRILQ